jgi:hypothetical protein
MRGMFWLVLVTILTLACRPVPAAKMDASRVFQATVGLMDTSRFIAIRSAYAASDGTVWIVWEDWGFGTAREPTWHVQRFSGAGARLGKDVSLFPRSGMVNLTAVFPVGTAPDGSLVVDFEPRSPDGEGRKRLAKISPSGSSEISDVLPPHFLGQPFVDRDGIAHLVLAPLSRVNYLQVDVSAKGLPVVRSLDYDQPSDGFASAPDYLKWGAGRRSMPGEIAFLSEQRGRLLVATPRHDSSGLLYSVYRIRTRTLALIDSGLVSLTRDVYRKWSGPVIPTTVIVPAGKSGYWIFSPTSDTPPSPTVIAYRLAPDLKVIRPTAVATDEAEPFAAAPADAVVSLWSSFTARDRWGNGAWVVPAKVQLNFIAFDGDGQLYAQTFNDSITSRVTK